MKLKRYFIHIAIITLFLTPCAAQESKFQELIPFEQNEKWGFINTKGEVVIKPQFDYADSFLNGLPKTHVIKDD